MNASLRTVIVTVAALLASAVCGCGLIELERTVFPNQATAPDGTLLFVEDLEDITNDGALLAADMEDALRDLGIDSEDLVTSIVDDGLGNTPPPAPPADGTGDGGDNSGGGNGNANGG